MGHFQKLILNFQFDSKIIEDYVLSFKHVTYKIRGKRFFVFRVENFLQLNTQESNISQLIKALIFTTVFIFTSIVYLLQ